MRKFGLSWRALSDGSLRGMKKTVLGRPIGERDGDSVTKKEGRAIRPVFERHAKSDLD
jgi:hypothetical protein